MPSDPFGENLDFLAPARAGLLGITAGLVTQSGRTTAFVLASFVQAGLLGARRGLPVVLWANLGCALITLVAVLPIHFVALLMIGIAGGCVAFERPRPLLGISHVVFGLALMLFGLKLMSAAAPVLPTLAGFDAALAAIERSPLYACLAGLVLTLGGVVEGELRGLGAEAPCEGGC
ncbi:MAG: hypothetical protein O9284_04740 [Steroidobacteraceae bacterium]|nr:hypothetical protein [Steroidobacteraceae bacterium]